MSAQNLLNQVERFHLERYTSGHIWLGQHHQHSSCSPRIIRPRRQIQSWYVPVSNILSIFCASGDGYPPDPSWSCSSGRPRTTWLDHISSDTGVSLTDTFSLAQDRSQWRAVATAAKATRTWLTDLTQGQRHWRSKGQNRSLRIIQFSIVLYSRDKN